MSLRLAAIALVLAAAPAWEPGRVTPEQLMRAMQDDQLIHVVDVRSPQAFAQGHIPGAINVPFAGLRQGAKPPATLHKGNPVYLYCTWPDEHSSAGAAFVLHDRFGYTRLKVLVGGMYAWEDAGLPIERGTPAPKPAASRKPTAPPTAMPRPQPSLSPFGAISPAPTYAPTPLSPSMLPSIDPRPYGR